MKPIFFNQKGFSIVEILVAAAISLIAVSGITSFSVHYRKLIRQEKLATIQKEFLHKASDVLSVTSSCSPLIQKATQSFSGDIAALATGDKITLDKTAFQESLQHPFFTVSNVELSYTAEAPATDMSAASSATTYSGFLTLTLDISNPRFMAYKDLVKNITVPIVLYDERSDNAWNNIQCASSQAPDTFIVGQICNTYGGTLTDGMHCDLLRNIRAGDHPLNNIPDYKLNQQAGSQVRRIAMSDVICYLDTLIIMAPANPLAISGPARDKTRFCRHPGTAAVSGISKDAKEVFNDVL